jgi:hypothetical protein
MKERTMPIKNFITGLVFLLFTMSCSSQQLAALYEGNLSKTGDDGDVVSEVFPFSVQESAFFTVIAECTDIDPVLVFHPSEGRGFVWDGAREGVLKYTGFFRGPETYDMHIRSYHPGEIIEPGFSIRIEKPAVVTRISPGETIVDDCASGGIEYSWYYEKLYVVDVEKTGLYSLTVTSDAELKCAFEGRKLMAFLRLKNPGDTAAKEIEIEEKGRYGISIRFFEKSEKKYRLIIELK